MREDVRVGAAGLLQRVGQDRQAIEGAVVVDRLCNFRNSSIVPTEPCGNNRDIAKRVANNVSQQLSLNCMFGVLVLPIIDDTGDVTHHEIDVVATLDRLVTVHKTPPGHDPCNLGELTAAARRDDLPPGMCLYLLLDEIAELSAQAQAILLRLFSEGEILPVGANRSRRVNVRTVMATRSPRS